MKVVPESESIKYALSATKKSHIDYICMCKIWIMNVDTILYNF